ncbi:MAG: hypothetical protein ACI4TK_13495 [Agathobacter sp.]
MIKVNSTVKLNKLAIQELTDAAVVALEKTADALRENVKGEQVVPRDTGTLQGEAFFVDPSESKNGKVSLVHSTPYARRLYFHPEYHFQKDENPNAKGEWYRDWEEGGKYEDFCKNAFAQLYRRVAGL